MRFPSQHHHMTPQECRSRETGKREGDSEDIPVEGEMRLNWTDWFVGRGHKAAPVKPDRRVQLVVNL